MKNNPLLQFSFFYLMSQLATLSLSAQTEPTVIAYVSVQGIKQGVFKGGSGLKGHESQIECLGFSYGIQSPRDAASGLPTGKRQHSPVVIVKQLDGSTPQLLQAAFTNEVLKSVTIDFARKDRTGMITIFQTIRLTNASVEKVGQYAGTISTQKLLPNTGALEEVSLTFQKIEIENKDAKTMAADNWSANN